MNKIISFFKVKIQNFIASVIKYKEINKIESVSITDSLVRGYAAKAMLALLFIMALINQWNPSNKGWSFEASTIIAVTWMTIIVLSTNFIVCMIMFFYVFFIENKKWLFILKSLLWIDVNVITPISEEFHNNISGFIVANIIFIATIVNQSWSKLLVTWHKPANHGIVLYDFSMFFLVCVVYPLFFSFANIWLSQQTATIKKKLIK